MKNILLEHKERYPMMQARDFLKLLYQSEFGGGHLIADPAAALNYLKSESDAVQTAPARQFEEIGSGLMRMYLPAKGIRPETALGLFMETCTPRGSMESLSEKLDLLNEMFPEMSGEIEAYRAAGCPAQRHSEIYRRHYAPAYRLVPESAEKFIGLFRAVDRLLAEKEFVRIAIDGRCASGKSTLGALLERVYGATLFHMDDYFLPFERKTPERLAQPGGNVDYERFYEEIASRPAGAEIVWRPFDCMTQALAEEIHVSPGRLTVVEGSYALHPELRGAYDLKVFLDIDPERQSARILTRNGPEMHKRFVNEWIPLENEYFDGLNIRALSDLAFDC
jgi:hypothetical protein